MTPATSWLPECSAAALTGALRTAAPELAGYPVTIAATPDGDERWHKLSTVLGERYVVKFAWSRPAALRLAREAAVTGALAPVVPFLPEIVARSTDPVLQVTRLVHGASLFEIVDSVDPDRAGRQLAAFLAALHSPAALERAQAAVGELTGAPLTGPVLPPPGAALLRERVPRLLPPDQRDTVVRWCEWAGTVPASPGPGVLVHGDLHGDNQVWRGGELRLVVDLETVAVAEAEYDLRSFPGPGTGPGVALLTAIVRHYERLTGRRLSRERVMAWNLRQSLGDVLWRSEAGLPLPAGRTPREWVRAIADRFGLLGIDPGSAAGVPVAGRCPERRDGRAGATADPAGRQGRRDGPTGGTARPEDGRAGGTAGHAVTQPRAPVRYRLRYRAGSIGARRGDPPAPLSGIGNSYNEALLRNKER